MTAGATPNQFLISRVIVSSAVMIFQAVEYMIYAIMIDERSHHSLGYLALIAVFLVTFGFSGMLFGFCVSILTDSLVEATYFTCISLFPFLTLAGKSSSTLRYYLNINILSFRNLLANRGYRASSPNNLQTHSVHFDLTDIQKHFVQRVQVQQPNNLLRVYCHCRLGVWSVNHLFLVSEIASTKEELIDD